MSERPRIGVTASVKGSRAMWWFNKLALARAGARAVRITVEKPYPISQLDGIVIGGGDDIDATLYGGEVDPVVRVDRERDQLELRILDHAERFGTPVLGICRGAQMLNVHRGGSLHEDIYEIYLKARKMRTVLPRKTVEIERNSRLCHIFDGPRCRVNALHHQSIDRLGRDLRTAAHDEFGIIQAIESPADDFLFGVQWHPEFLVFDRHQQNLFRALIAAARRHRHTR